MRAPSPLPLLSLPTQSAGEMYVGTPSFSNCSRGATPPLARVEVKEAERKSGSLSRTFSEEGRFSDIRSTCGVGLLQALHDRVAPGGGPGEPVGEPEREQDLGRPLVDGDGPLGRGLHRDGAPAVLDGERKALGLLPVGGPGAFAPAAGGQQEESRREQGGGTYRGGDGRGQHEGPLCLWAQPRSPSYGSRAPVRARAPAGLRTRVRPGGTPSRSRWVLQWPWSRPSPSPLRVSSGLAPDSLTPSLGFDWPRQAITRLPAARARCGGPLCAGPVRRGIGPPHRPGRTWGVSGGS